MKQALRIFVFFSTVLAQNVEIRQYKQKLKTATGKERVDVINNLLSLRNVPEFRGANKALAREAISLADSLKYAEGRVDSWNSMAWLQTEIDSIKKYAERADLVSDAIGYQKGIASVLLLKADIDQKNKQYGRAIEKTKKAESLYGSLGETILQANCLNHICVLYQNMGDYGSQLDYSIQAMDVLLKHKESSHYNTAKVNAIRAYKNLGNEKRALFLSLELIKESLASGDSTNYSNALYDASTIYRALGVLDSAVYYSKKVLELDIKLNNNDFILSDYSLIGDIFKEMGELDSALTMYKKTEKTLSSGKNLSISEKINFTTGNKINLGEIYFLQGNKKGSLPYLLDALELATEQKQKNYIQSANHILSQFYEKEKKYEKALEHYKGYIAYKDTLTGQEAQNKMANLEIQKEVSRGDAERAVLEQKTQIQNLEISKQKTIRNALASAAFFIIALGWALVQNIRARNKSLEEENRRKQEELESALQLQLSMLPHTTPETDSYITAAKMNAAETVGGDYYDFFQQDDGSVYVVCGDATGHGMAAGMVVSMTKTGLETISSEAPDNLLKKLNQTITKMNTGRNQMALAVAKLDGNNLEYSSAAMPPTYLFRKSDNSLNELSATGLPLGAMRKETYITTKEQLREGDVLVMLSDGLPERTNKQQSQLDYPAIENCVKDNAHRSPNEIVKKLESLGETFADGEPNQDDITIVVLKKK